MRRFLTAFVAAVLGFVPAYLVSHRFRNTPATPPAHASEASATAGRIASGTQRTGEAHTFEQLLKAFDRVAIGPPLRRELERMSSRELREWAAEPAADDEREPKAMCLRIIAEILYERDGMASLEWADQLPKVPRETVLRAMVLEAVKDSPVEAKPWVDKVLNDYGRVSNYSDAAEAAARGRGAKDLAEVHDTYPGLGFSGFGYAAFARDFDFQEFAGLVAGKHFVPAAYTAWASRDAEAAAADVIERCGDDPMAVRYTSALFKGMAALRGDAEAAGWIAGLLDDIPVSLRPEAVKGLRGNAMLSATEVEAIITALPTPDDRILYAGQVVSPYGNPEATRQAFNALQTVEARTAVLLHIAPQYQRMAADDRNRGGPNDPVAFFQTTMEELDLPESARQQVMDILLTPPTRQ